MCARKRLTRQERKKEIMEAGARLFIEKGFAKTSMEDIVGETSLSKGGVYHYYSSTIDILHDLMIEGNNYRLALIQEAFEKRGLEELLKEEEDQIPFAAKMIVEKMIDDNYYMSIYAVFLLESKRNEKLRQLLYRLKAESLSAYQKLFENLDQDTRSRIGDDFLMNFVNSIILGGDILGARESFKENKDLLVEMVKLYLYRKID